MLKNDRLYIRTILCCKISFSRLGLIPSQHIHKVGVVYKCMACISVHAQGDECRLHWPLIMTLIDPDNVYVRMFQYDDHFIFVFLVLKVQFPTIMMLWTWCIEGQSIPFQVNKMASLLSWLVRLWIEMNRTKCDVCAIDINLAWHKRMVRENWFNSCLWVSAQ